MTQARGITCPSCRTWIEDRGRLRRCPVCGVDLQASPLPSLPGYASSSNLDAPAFATEEAGRNDTAPASEFAAAGAVVGGIVLLIAGAMLASGIVAILGVTLIFGVTGFFAFARGSVQRTLQHGWSTFLWPFRGRD
jgi:hypothetical protein